MISFESIMLPGHYLTFDALNNWQCIFQEIPSSKLGDASTNVASFKVLKFGLVELDRGKPRESSDVLNANNLLSFESAAY